MPNCHEKGCHSGGTNQVYDERLSQHIAFCDDHIDEWRSKSYIGLPKVTAA